MTTNDRVGAQPPTRTAQPDHPLTEDDREVLHAQLASDIVSATARVGHRVNYSSADIAARGVVTGLFGPP